MHHLGWCRLNRFQNHVVILRRVEFHNSEKGTSHLVFKWRFAEFTLQGFPEIRGDLFTRINLAFAVQPTPEALYVDLTHGASTLARTDEGVVIFFLRQTNATDCLFAHSLVKQVLLLFFILNGAVLSVAASASIAL